MSTENGAKHKHQVDGTSHPVVDIEELDKELRLRSRNRKMQRERENKKEGSKENMKKSELRDLLSSVSEGNVVALCTCQQSKDFPYCDNTHAVFNKATNSNLSPLYIAFVEGKKGVCDECGSKKKNTSQTQDNSTAPESPGCSITLSDCTNTDSSILDNDTPTTSTSSTSTSSTTTTSPTLTLRRRSIRKSTETATTCQCSTTTSSPTHPHTTNASTTTHNTDTTSRDSTNRDTTSKDTTSRDTTSKDTTSRDTTSTTSSSSVSREGSVDITLPHSSDPEEDDDHNTNDNNNKEKEGKEESKTITTPPPVILATSNATTTRDEESEGKATTTIKYIPSSIKDPRNRDNIISKYEVSQHNTQTDLWMIIKGNVYDITKYVKSHPGGVRALVKFAGKDGTENVQYHSSAMLEILNSRYYIGRLPKEEGGPGGGCIIC